MATEVILPRVDMDMTEGKVAVWHVKDGDVVRKGQVLFEIETDKAAMEVDATADGVMHGIRAAVGAVVPVGEVIAWILAPGEAAPAPSTPSDEAPKPGAAAAEASTPGADAAGAAPLAADAATDRRPLRATPLARSLAREQGVDLAQLGGNGPGGRVLARDLQAAPAHDGRPAATATHALHLQWPRRGAGTPLLLIHGFGAEQGSWRPLVQALPAAHEAVLAIDLPHHGKSAALAVRTLEDLARAVLQRLDQEDVEAVHLLGHSLGGGVALALAQLAPRRVASLTLLAPAALGPEVDAAFIDGLLRAGDEAALKAALQPLFHDPAGLTGSFVATAWQQLQAPQRRAGLTALAEQLMPRGRQSQNLREVLPTLEVPVQLIWGTRDRVIPARDARDVPAHVGVHLLPDVGHLPQVEAAATVAALVDLQLRGAQQARAA